PDEGYRFVEWTGDNGTIDDTEAADTTITMNGNYTITAEFEEIPTYTLTVTVEGEGTVDIDPDQEEYEEGTEVTLTAIPADGWQFVEWTGDADGESEETNVVMDSDKEVTANFEEEEEPVVEYELTIDSTEGGEVVEPGEDTFVYEEGTSVTLEAVPDEGYVFAGWTGDVNEIEDPTVNDTSITMQDNYSITAEFEEEGEAVEYDLTIDSTEGGEVTEPGEDTFVYGEDTTVDLEAVAEDGYVFAGWTGDVDAIDDTEAAETTITMLDNYSITAEFEEEEPVEEYTLTINIDGEGTVEVNGEEVEDGWSQDYEADEEVTLTVEAADGWQFVEWTGDHEGTEEEITITMDSDKEITANFEEETMDVWWILAFIVIALVIIVLAAILARRKEKPPEEEPAEEAEEELEEEETAEEESGEEEELEEETGEEEETAEEAEEEPGEEESVEEESAEEAEEEEAMEDEEEL
ncbi:MAG: InlB B-repeat-containing protein, partial [Candidatus Aenigmatarchaeota archaeon]